jgi:ABC-2 type transport system permease protein
MAGTSKSVKRAYSLIILLIVVAAVVLLNIIGSLTKSRIDMTEDQRYSLAPSTVRFLEDGQLNSKLLIKVYLEGNLPAEIARFRDAIETKLQEFREYAGDNLEYEFIDPKEGSESDQTFLRDQLIDRGNGVLPLRIQYTKDGVRTDMEVFPGAVIEYEGARKGVVQFLPGTVQGQFYTLNANFEEQIRVAVNNLEYQLISAIRRSTLETKPRIAFLQGHGELRMPETIRVRRLLEQYYTVEDISLNDSVEALKNVKGLIIANPVKPFSEKDQFLIDQFLLKGGRLMCFVDQITFPQDTLDRTGSVYTTRTDVGIDKLLYNYGVKVNDNYVLDAYCAPKALPMAKQSIIPWFFEIMATPTRHPISRNIDPVILRYTSELQFIEDEDRVATPILTSSTNSTLTPLAPFRVTYGLVMNYNLEKPELVPDPENEANKHCVAGLVEGRFESYFKNRIVDEYARNKESGYVEQSTKEGKLLVVGNGRFIRNSYDSMTNAIGKTFYRPSGFNELRYDLTMAKLEGAPPILYGNEEFFQNAVDYMMDDNSVIDLRSRQIDIRPLDQDKVRTESGFYRMLNVGVPVLVVIFLGLLLFYLRKRRYAR